MSGGETEIVTKETSAKGFSSIEGEIDATTETDKVSIDDKIADGESEEIASSDHEDDTLSILIKNLPNEILIAMLSRISRTSIGPASGVCSRWRYIIQSREFFQQRLPILESCLAVFSASTAFDDKEQPVRVQLYQPQSKRWSSSKFMAIGVNIDDFSTSCASERGAYLFSGVIGNCRMNSPIFYNFWTNEAKYIAKLNTPRMKFVCGEIEGKLYVAGGVKNRIQLREPVNQSINQPKEVEKTEIYEVDKEEEKKLERGAACLNPFMRTGGSSSSKEWKRIIKRVIPKRRRSMSSLQLYEPEDLNSCEVFDPETECWEEFPSMNFRRVGCFGGAIDGKLYVVGGTSKDRVRIFLNALFLCVLHVYSAFRIFQNLILYSSSHNLLRICPFSLFALAGLVN